VSALRRHPNSTLLTVLTVLTVLVCALLLPACGSSPGVQFYRLTPAPAIAARAPVDLALAIGPAQFPRALARSQIVTRSGDNQVKVDEYHVWSAPLEYEFLRVLGDNIAADLQSNRIAVYPKEAAFALDYRITLDVLQFDGIPGESVTLRVRWAIAPAAGEAVAVGSFEQVQPTAAGDASYNTLAAAHSDLVATLATSISSELRKLVN
jgi:uncharacterized lipoprotein YmbA